MCGDMETKNENVLRRKEQSATGTVTIKSSFQNLDYEGGERERERSLREMRFLFV